MRWDEQRRRYVDERGRVISPREVRRRIERYIESEQEEVRSRALEVLHGASLALFFHYMSAKIRVWHSAAGVMAYGGEREMTRERWARVENKIQSELSYLASFEAEIQRRAFEAEVTEALASRAAMYVESTYATYENNVVAREWDEGATLGRRVCEEDDASCEECVAAADTYFVPLSEIPEIGSLRCLTNCRCHIETAEPNPTATMFIDRPTGFIDWSTGEGLPA